MQEQTTIGVIRNPGVLYGATSWDKFMRTLAKFGNPMMFSMSNT